VAVTSHRQECRSRNGKYELKFLANFRQVAAVTFGHNGASGLQRKFVIKMTDDYL